MITKSNNFDKCECGGIIRTYQIGELKIRLPEVCFPVKRCGKCGKYYSFGSGVSPVIFSEPADDGTIHNSPCDNCGGEIKVYFPGDGVYKCSVCGKAYGEVTFKEASSERNVPVYIMLMHTGTALANAIKKVTGSNFSHSSISFDPSMRNMYSFGRKADMNPFIGGFKKEDIYSPFFKNRDVQYSLYVVFCTQEEVDRMKKRLEFFTKNQTKLNYDFTGLFKNYLGIEDNPEYKWFCSRFVADIINSGRPKSDPFIKSPSLVKPHEFADMPFTIYITGGDLHYYRPKLVERLVEKQLSQINESSKNEIMEGVDTMGVPNMLGQMYYEFFGEVLDGTGYMMEKSEGKVPDAIEPIIKIIEDKGYEVKYASPGYVDGRFKNDRDKDGVINGKMTSTGRVIFARNYRFSKTPEGWGWKALHNGFKALYVKPLSNNPNNPTDYNLITWHNNCLKNLRTWAEDLPQMGTLKDTDLEYDKHLAVL